MYMHGKAACRIFFNPSKLFQEGSLLCHGFIEWFDHRYLVVQSVSQTVNVNMGMDP